MPGGQVNQNQAPGRLESAGRTPLHRGANQSGVRDHNQRVVLSLVRRYGSLSKTEIARMAEMSAQTSSVIMRELENDGLLSRGEPQRGKIGQPSIPLSLNADGAYFLGLKIGRRSAELVLIDFLGQIREMRQFSYPYPATAQTLEFAISAISSVHESLSAEQRSRLSGLGVAMPFDLWNWAAQAGAPAGSMDDWRVFDLRGELQSHYSFPVYLQNDASSACGAELVFGQTGLQNFVYFYIGAFAGGGVVLDGRLHVGSSGNAGALGSMPVSRRDGTQAQLIDVASLATLERDLRADSQDTTYLWVSPQDWAGNNPPCDGWLADAGRALAYAIVSASSVIDFEAAIIDGWMPKSIRAKLVASVQFSMQTIDAQGLRLPLVRQGNVGIHARAIGAASLPLSERYLTGSIPLNNGERS